MSNKIHDQYEKARKRTIQKKRFYIHVILFFIGSSILYGFTLVKGFELSFNITFIYILIAVWFIILILHFIKTFITNKFFGQDWERKQTENLLKKHDKKVLQLEKKLQKQGILPKEIKERKSFFSKKKQIITIIAAVGNQNVLGKDNKLLWHLPNDLKHFKKLTTGHDIIMGRKTYESIGKPLPNRTNIIITRNKDYEVPYGCLVVSNLEEALDAARKDESPFIIGGAQIYNLAMPVVNKIELTQVHYDFEADVFFPEIDSNMFQEISREIHKADEKNKYDYSFVTYVRKQD